MVKNSIFAFFDHAIVFRMVGLVGKSDFRIAKFAFFDHLMTLKSFFKKIKFRLVNYWQNM